MTDDLTLNMDAYLPLRDVVFNTLREAILKGELKPGERLMELQLAAKLGVSRTPIREAIRMLEQEGLAVTIPRKGAEVAKMTEKDMEDVLQIRDALDELAASIACEQMTKEQLDTLTETMHEFEESTKSKDLKKIAAADVQFHDIIYQATGNPKLVNMLSDHFLDRHNLIFDMLMHCFCHTSLILCHQSFHDLTMFPHQCRIISLIL